MKILFTARATLFAQPGGDTQQMGQAAEALRALGAEVDIRLRGEDAEPNNYDIIHFFNLGRPADLPQRFLKSGKPIVISSIWVDYSAWESMQSGIRGWAFWLLKASGVEYLKTLARAARGTDKRPELSYIFRGQKASMLNVAKRAQVIVTTSESEKNRLDDAFGVGDKCRVVPLGVALQNTAAVVPHLRAGVLCVSRIEGLKNQLNLIRAAQGAQWKLTLIGKAAANQQDYYESCLQEAGPNVHFAGWQEYESVIAAYQTAKVLVLPSYFETFGLVALEALASGCNLVLANRPDMNQIFAGRALFCDPSNPADIREKVEKALALPPTELPEGWWQQFSWQNHAQQLLEIYRTILHANTST